MQKFFKMSCAGNDYFYTFGKKPSNGEIQALCSRYIGCGSDGVVIIKRAGKNYRMQIYNSDSSSATFCGNATMSVAKYLFDNRLVEKREFLIGTGAGLKAVKVLGKNICKRVILRVGKPSFFIKKGLFVPQIAVNQTFNLATNGEVLSFIATAVWVGNLHLVVTQHDGGVKKMKQIVDAVADSGLFPKGVNVEFVRLVKGEARAVVFERGSGKTLACGSGCVAIFAVLNKLKLANKSLNVRFEGGVLKAFEREGEIFLSGVPRYQNTGGKNGNKVGL